RLVCYAGWTDKYAALLGNQNPVAAPFYNFTTAEPTGVVAVIAPDEAPLLALVSLLAPPLAAGNTVIALGSGAYPLATALLGEVAATSDVPAGVLNLLTGYAEELADVVATHRGVDGIHAAGCAPPLKKILEEGVAENLKRVRVRDVEGEGWFCNGCESPLWIEPFVEMKTIWHPRAL
nr:aldehyde dehydrogenase family protein [bacterium]